MLETYFLSFVILKFSQEISKTLWNSDRDIPTRENWGLEEEKQSISYL